MIEASSTLRLHRMRIASHLAASCLAAMTLIAAGGVAAFEIKPEARLHLDYGHNDPDTRPLDDGVIVRRATVGIKGDFARDWPFEISYEMTHAGVIEPDDGKFKDVYVTYAGWSAGELTAGQFKIPFGLDELISSNDTTFIERALPLEAFAPSRRLGIGFARKKDAYTASTMAFGSSIDGDDRGRGIAARVTAAPLRSAEILIHLGLAAAAERPRSRVDFDAAPESRVPDVDLVNTGGIDAVDRIDRIGLEGAWRSGPVSVQSEWIQTAVRRDNGQPTAYLDGWYVAVSWVLTGESRPYKYGRFKGIDPSRPTGAWELAARSSHVDLDGAGIRGGSQRNLTVGLNYYLNEHLRIMVNYIDVSSERRGRPDDPNLWLVRLQMVL